MTETDRESAHSLSFHKWEVFRQLMGRLFICVTVIVVVYVGIYLPIRISAGTTTTVRYLLDFAMIVDAHVWIAWVTTLP